jgi:hypothetical protein
MWFKINEVRLVVSAQGKHLLLYPHCAVKITSYLEFLSFCDYYLLTIIVEH